jgi:hypothetical protein
VTIGALERVVRRGVAQRQAAGERCELCREHIPEEHRHVLDQQRDEVQCICRPCALLFAREAAARGHYRIVPERRLRLEGVSPSMLGVPVGLAYFVRQGDGAVVAHYPSPMGATQWEIEAQRWADVVARCSALETMVPDVEALLVNTAGGSEQRWLLPIDDCYRLVAIVMREWKGLSGGDQVWPQIQRFFNELTPRR